MWTTILCALLPAVAAIVYGVILIGWISRQPAGSDRMQAIAKAIQEGARAYLKRQYRTVALVAVAVFILLWIFLGWKTGIGFIVGAIFSGVAGYLGMTISVKANVRTAEAARKGFKEALNVAVKGGSITGLLVVGLGLLGVSGFYLIFKDLNALIGLAFGGSLISIFARIGGGIFTKAADVGADLVGKVEKGIPEDDPRNPAVIADNVGDNVGDVAGMGADLFESYVNSIIAAMVLGVAAVTAGADYVILPLVISAFGIIASIIGMAFVRAKSEKQLFGALNVGLYVSTFLTALFTFIYIEGAGINMGVFYAALSGLVVGVIIGLFTEYYTSNKNKPTQSIAEAAKTGAGTNLIQGMSVGMFSTAVPVISVAAAVLISYRFADIYGIAIAGVGMLATLGFTLAI